MVLVAIGWISSPAGGVYDLAGGASLLPCLYRTSTGRYMAGDGGLGCASDGYSMITLFPPRPAVSRPGGSVDVGAKERSGNYHFPDLAPILFDHQTRKHTQKSGP
jgi:hypothetical protein